MKYIDLTQTIREGMPVYPGDRETLLKADTTINDHGFNTVAITLCNHSGTHIDTPLHMISGAKGVDSYPPEHFCGPATVLDVRGREKIGYEGWMDERAGNAGIVLLHTGHDRYWSEGTYFKCHPILDISMARFLVRKGVRIVGLDSPSPDGESYEIHRYLFENDICIIENLCKLDQLLPYQKFELFALPLKLDGDAAPMRAVAQVDK